MLTGAALPVTLLLREVCWDLSFLHAGTMHGALIQGPAFTTNSNPSRGLLGWRLLPLPLLHSLLHSLPLCDTAKLGSWIVIYWDKCSQVLGQRISGSGSKQFWLVDAAVMFSSYHIQWLRKRGIASFCYLGLHIARG